MDINSNLVNKRIKGEIDNKMIGIFYPSSCEISPSTSIICRGMISFDDFKNNTVKGIKVKDKVYFKYYKEQDFVSFGNPKDITKKELEILKNVDKPVLFTFTLKGNIYEKILCNDEPLLHHEEFWDCEFSNFQTYEENNAILKLRNLIYNEDEEYTFFSFIDILKNNMAPVIASMHDNNISPCAMSLYMLCIEEHTRNDFISKTDIMNYASYWNIEDIQKGLNELLKYEYFSDFSWFSENGDDIPTCYYAY